MIMFERFEAAKIRRFINRYRKPYTFKRSDLNAYNEPTDGEQEVCNIYGVYHEASYKHLAAVVADAGVHIPEVEPMILCLKDEVTDLIKVDDFVYVNEKKMIVTKKKDINNSGFAYDISLRHVDYGEEA